VPRRRRELARLAPPAMELLGHKRSFTARSAGSDCLDSAPRKLSESPAGFAELGAFRFCRGMIVAVKS
jgi:hypothetical protein